MDKLLKKISDILFIVVIIILVIYFVLRNMGIFEIYEVETGSMEQGIHVGDYVLICRKNNYVVGDIVTYKKDDYYVTHRIIKSINGDKVITKGDANNVADDEIDKSAIVGKVILIGSLLNYLIEFKFGIISLFLGIYLLTCYFSKDRSKTIVDKDKLVDKNNEKKIVKNEIGVKKRLKKRIRSQYRNI